MTIHTRAPGGEDPMPANPSPSSGYGEESEAMNCVRSDLADARPSPAKPDRRAALRKAEAWFMGSCCGATMLLSVAAVASFAAARDWHSASWAGIAFCWSLSAFANHRRALKAEGTRVTFELDGRTWTVPQDGSTVTVTLTSEPRP